MDHPLGAHPARAALPLVFGRGGAPESMPEHSLPGYYAAAHSGADYLHCELRVTADGTLVVLRERDLVVVTDVASKFPGREADGVRTFALAELRESRRPRACLDPRCPGR